MVVWRVGTSGDATPTSPDFLPRLGGPISHLAVSRDGSLATVSTTNNVIRLTTVADRHRLWTVRGLSLAAADPEDALSSNHRKGISPSSLNRLRTHVSCSQPFVANMTNPLACFFLASSPCVLGVQFRRMIRCFGAAFVSSPPRYPTRMQWWCDRGRAPAVVWF